MKKGILILLAAALAVPASACTNLIVTRGASADGSSMITYAADSHQLYGALKFMPARDWPEGTMLDVYEWDTGKYLGQIPQVSHTYQVIGNMNEHQLAIGETTYGGIEYVDSTAILDYGSLIYIALQRCRTAREAIQTIADLMDKYGYASEGESFSISDPDECWIMEMICKQPKFDKKGRNVNRGAAWVAKRIPDGYISGHANQARITTIDFDDPENCMYSKDIVKYARETGLYSGSDADFSFSDVFNPLEFGAARGCEARVWSFFNRFAAQDMNQYLDYAMGYNLTNRMPLYVKPSHKITVKELADMMRDHFEGTPMDMTTDIGAGGSHLPYRWRPMEWEYEGHSYVNERAIATQQTGWWFVAQGRKDNVAGGIFWFGVDDAATSPLTPFYCKADAIPHCYKEGVGSLIEYSDESMYWLVSRIAQFAYLRYDKIGAEVRQNIDDWEKMMIEEAVPSMDANAAKLASDPAAMSRELGNICCATAEALFTAWQKLDKHLLVKYIDGNIKRQNPDGSFRNNGFDPDIPASPIQEPYSDKWKENVVRDNGKVLLIPE